MATWLDHVVLWVEDPWRALGFYQEILGMPGLRVDEFRAGKAPFLSVRVSDDVILDLMAREGASAADEAVGAKGSAGHPIHHICLAMEPSEFHALRTRLGDHGVTPSEIKVGLFGARGPAPEGFYFSDPDNNIIEVRHYG